MIVASFAALAEGKTITISTLEGDKGTHEYSAYQIFSGDIEDGKLVNIQWGANVSATQGAALITAIQANTTLNGIASVAALTAGTSSAAELAAALGNITSDTDNAALLGEVIGAWIDAQNITASKTSTKSGTNYLISDLNEGYYFVKDTGTDDPEAQSAFTNYILRLVANVDVTPKASITIVEKKVDDKDDTTGTEDTITWQDSADYDVGDTIPYKVTGTLPSNYLTYDKYEYKFTDNLTKGLALQVSSIKVYYYASKAAADADTGATPTGTDITDLFDILPASNSDGASATTMTVTAKAGANNKYLRESATLGNNGAIVVRYNAVLTDDATYTVDGAPNTVFIEYSNNPNGDGKGKTEEDKVTVLKFKLIVHKTQPGESANTTKPLAGAKFLLLKKYNKAADVPTGKTTYTSESATVPANSQASDYVVTGTQVWAEVTEIDDSTAKTATFTFNGLDAGDYMLVETFAPQGFNAAAPKKFTVQATHDTNSADPKLTELKVVDASGAVISEFTTTLEAAQIDVSVLNNSGTQLPSTGGIGTTLFYIGGGVLVLAAVILLVTKRRMNAND